MKNRSLGKKSKQIVRALGLPVIRFCLSSSVSWQELTSILKDLFIEAAVQELSDKNTSPTLSQLSALTGIRRPDISEALSGLKPQGMEKQHFLTRIIGQWLYDRRFSKKPGHPNPLTIVGGESQFARLTASVSADLNFRTILSELVRINAVELTTKGSIELARLRVSEFVDRRNTTIGYEMLAEDIADLSVVIQENLGTKDLPPHLHIRTAFDNVPEKDLPKIQEWLFRLGSRVHEEARQYLSKFDRDMNPGRVKPGKRSRVLLATFSLVKTPHSDDKDN